MKKLKNSLFLRSFLFVSPILITSCSSLPATNENEDKPNQNDETDDDKNQGEDPKPIEKSLVIKADKTYIGINEYINLSVLDQDNKEAKATFTSSDEKVATVSSSGIVKGISYGKATISATSKDDSSLKASIEITVGESVTLDSVVNKLKKANSYKTTYKGELTYKGQKYNINNVEEVTDDSYYFNVIDNNLMFQEIGYASNLGELFEFKRDGENITSATYLREHYDTYKQIVYLANEMNGNYYSLLPVVDNEYDITNTSDKELLFRITFQNTRVDFENISDYLLDISTIKANVISPNEFTISMSFDGATFSSGSLDINFSSFDEIDDAYLANYLKDGEVQVPSTYEDVSTIFDLVKNNNYTSDLGSFTITDDSEESTTHPIGDIHYTDKYCFYNYSDEYLTYTNQSLEELGETTKLVRGGYLNKNNSVYTFTVDEANTITLGEKVTSELPSIDITNYQDFTPTISTILNAINSENKLYSFMPFSSDMFDGKEYCSNNMTALDFLLSFDSDAISAGGTPFALCIGINKNSQNINQSEIVLGGCYQFVDMGNLLLPPIYTSYNNFNGANIDFIDAFLLNS